MRTSALLFWFVVFGSATSCATHFFVEARWDLGDIVAVTGLAWVIAVSARETRRLW